MRLVRRFVSGNFKAPFESGKKERSRNSNVFTEGKAEFHVEAFVGRRRESAQKNSPTLTLLCLAKKIFIDSLRTGKSLTESDRYRRDHCTRFRLALTGVG